MGERALHLVGTPCSPPSQLFAGHAEEMMQAALAPGSGLCVPTPGYSAGGGPALLKVGVGAKQRVPRLISAFLFHVPRHPTALPLYILHISRTRTVHPP